MSEQEEGGMEGGRLCFFGGGALSNGTKLLQCC